MSTEVEIPDIAQFQGAIASVRSDSDPVNWMLAGHVGGNPNLLHCVGTGTGGVTELVHLLSDTDYMYALVRLEETVDLSTTIKFVYVLWHGEKVPFTKRGKYGVVSGSVEKHFAPYHSTFEVTNKEELTEENLMKQLAEQSGTKSKEINKEVAASRQDRGFTSSSNVIKTGRTVQGVQVPKGVDVLMDDSVRVAIAEVRSDESQTNWCVAGYEGNNPRNPVVLLGKGIEGLDGIVSTLSDDSVGYSLLRMTDVVDEIPTVKFVFITWVGERVKPMTKGKISSHKSTMDSHFSPAHVRIHASNISELSEPVIMDKVQKASGSKSYVK